MSAVARPLACEESTPHFLYMQLIHTALRTRLHVSIAGVQDTYSGLCSTQGCALAHKISTGKSREGGKNSRSTLEQFPLEQLVPRE